MGGEGDREREGARAAAWSPEISASHRFLTQAPAKRSQALITRSCSLAKRFKILA